uniref:Alpha-tectorin-like n=1 Tax=Phallusia mammillata TaxID=59560 RepID=A0A6F9DV51_9ASCI|nr:alpha-tectorin-like [Phallusia mammillata]
MKFILCVLAMFVSSTLAQDLVQVVCAQDSITAKIKKQVVQTAGYTIDDIHLNGNDCVFDQEDEEFYIKVISPLGACQTHQKVNETHVVYSNTISTVTTGPNFEVVIGPRANQKVLSARIRCTYRIDLNVSTMFIPNITIVDIPIPDAFGIGEFQASMSLFTDATYSTPYTEPPTLAADETLFVGVTLLGTISEDIFLLIQDCWGTISNDPNALPRYPLVADGCAIPTAGDGGVQVTRNGDSHQGTWNSPVFKFVGGSEQYDNVWLHCDLQLCINKPCMPTCPAKRRKRRDVDGETETKKIWGPGDFTDQHIITLGPISKLTIESVPDNQIKVSYVEVDPDTYIPVKHQSNPNDRTVWNPTVIAVIAVMGSLAVICVVLAIVVIAVRSRRRSDDGITLGGIGNKGFVA